MAEVELGTKDLATIRGNRIYDLFANQVRYSAATVPAGGTGLPRRHSGTLPMWRLITASRKPTQPGPLKRRPHSWPARTLLAALLLIASPGAGRACDCIRAGVAERFALSDWVFVGETMSFTRLERVRLRVLAAFKGAPPADVTVDIGASMCDYFLPPVEPKHLTRYLVYATRHAETQTITASRCLGSGRLGERQADIAWLRGRNSGEPSR
jgi:hypothetical protein